VWPVGAPGSVGDHDVSARFTREAAGDADEVVAVGDHADELQMVVSDLRELVDHDAARLAVLERHRRRVPCTGAVHLHHLAGDLRVGGSTLDQVRVALVQDRARDQGGRDVGADAGRCGQKTHLLGSERAQVPAQTKCQVLEKHLFAPPGAYLYYT